MKTKIALIAITVLVILALANIQQVEAITYYYKDHSIPKTTLLETLDPNRLVLYHQSGKTITAEVNTDVQTKALIYILSSTGVLIGNYTLACNPSGSDLTIRAIQMYDFSPTQVLIETFCSTTVYYYAYFTILNINALTVTQAYSTDSMGTSGTVTDSYSGGLYKIGSNYYAVNSFKVGGGTNAGAWLIVHKFNGVATVTFGVSTKMGSNDPNFVLSFVGNSTLTPYNDDIFILTTFSDDTLPIYYKYDCTGSGLLLLATNPVNYRYISNQQIKLINSGLLSYSTYYIMYFTYAYSYLVGTAHTIYVCHNSILFNNTVASASLITQGNIVQSISVSIPASVYPSVMFGGYASPKETINVYYGSMESGATIVRKEILTIPDFYNLGLTSFTTVSDTVVEIPILNIYEIVGRNWTQPIQLSIYPTSKLYRFFYNLIDINAVYSMTIAFTPSDTPMESNTNYAMVTQFRSNGVGKQAVEQIYLDNILQITKTTDINGIASANVRFYETGIKNITHVFYISDTKVFTQVNTYTVVSATVDPNVVPDPTVVSNNMMVLAFGMLPNMGLILLIGIVPLIAGYEMKSMLVFTMMLIIDSIIAYMGGLLPLYAMLMIFIGSIAFIIISPTRNNNNSSG